MLSGKTILLGVTGSIAAYKIANLASMLVKLHADVHVIMTHNACHFITPMTFETLTGHKCIVDTTVTPASRTPPRPSSPTLSSSPLPRQMS